MHEFEGPNLFQTVKVHIGGKLESVDRAENQTQAPLIWNLGILTARIILFF